MSITYGKILKSEIDLIDKLIGFTDEEVEDFKDDLWRFCNYYNREIIDKYGEEKAGEITTKLRNVIKSCYNNPTPFTDSEKAMLLEAYAVPEIVISKIDETLASK